METNSANFVDRGNDFLFNYWYYTLNNEDRIDYKIFSFWSEYGNATNLFDSLPLKDLKLNEEIFIDFDCSLLGIEREITADFKTDTFKICRIQYKFIEHEESIEVFKDFQIEPIYEKL